MLNTLQKFISLQNCSFKVLPPFHSNSQSLFTSPNLILLSKLSLVWLSCELQSNSEGMKAVVELKKTFRHLQSIQRVWWGGRLGWSHFVTWFACQSASDDGFCYAWPEHWLRGYGCHCCDPLMSTVKDFYHFWLKVCRYHSPASK